MKELMKKPNLTTKEQIKLNNIKEEMSGIPNPNSTIAATAIQKAIRGKKVRKELAMEADQLKKQIEGVEKKVNKAKTEHVKNVFDDLAYKTIVKEGKNKAMDKLTKHIANVETSITTRGQKEDKSKRLIRMNGAKDKLVKTTFKKVGRPRKTQPMTVLETYVGLKQTEI